MTNNSIKSDAVRFSWNSWVSESGGISPWMIPFVNNRYLRAMWKLFVRLFPVTGRWVAGLTFVLLFYGLSTWPSTQLFVPFLYVFGLWAVALGFALFYRPRMSIAIHKIENVSVGGVANVTATVQQASSRVRFEISFLPAKLPRSISLIQPEGAEIAPLQLGSREDVTAGVLCKRRGVYEIKHWRLQTAYPLNVLYSSRTYVTPMQFVVTPRFVPILKMDLPAGSRHHTGGQSESTAKGKSYDYAGNREYRVGDNIGHIDWSATARLRTTIVREYRDEYFNRVGIILDTHTVEPTRIVSTNEFESAVSLTAAISDYITKNDYQTEVFCTEDAFVEPAGLSRFGKHAEIMMALANTEPTHVSSVERIVPKLQDRTGNVSVWLIVLLDWTEERSAFVNQLSATGAFVKVYVVRNCVPTDPYPSSETYRPLSILTPQDVMSGLIE